MKKNRLSRISLILSIISLIAIFLVNYDLALQYLNTDGKGRLLFGIYEYLELPYKYGIAIILLISVVLLIVAFKKREGNQLMVFTLIIIILSIISMFLRIWKLMV